MQEVLAALADAFKGLTTAPPDERNFTKLANLTDFADSNPLAACLLAFIFIDIASGLIAAGLEKKISSKYSFNGMYKKFQVILIVSTASILEWTIWKVLGQRWPIAGAAFLFFIGTEAISILENAARSKVPVPVFLKDMLIALRDKASTGEVLAITGGIVTATPVPGEKVSAVIAAIPGAKPVPADVETVSGAIDNPITNSRKVDI